MTATKAHIRATEKYNAKAYDEIKLRVKKGEKSSLQAIAAEQGISVNSFITTAIEHYLLEIKKTDSAFIAPDDKPAPNNS